MESPESRTFAISNLEDYVKTNRKDLVAAALTILRAYHLADRPRQQVKPWGGFESWSASIRESLVWLGMADPCKTRTVVLADDPEREESLAAFRALHAAFEDAEFTAKRILQRCDSKSALRTAMLNAAAGRQKDIDSRSLGWWLRRVHDRILGGLRLEIVGKASGVARWRVVKVPSGHRGQGGQFPVADDKIKRFPRLADD